MGNSSRFAKDLSVTAMVTVKEAMTRKDTILCKDWSIQTVHCMCAKSQNKEGSVFSTSSD